MASYDEFKQLLRDRQYADAATLAEAAALDSGRDAPFWMNQQSIALLRMKRYDEAAAIADRALHLAPQSFYSLLIRSEAFFQLGKADAALEGFREALRYTGAKKRAQKGILDCLLSLRRFDEVQSALAGWDDLPANEGYPWRVKALDGMERPDEAITVCKEWLGSVPDDRAALWLLCELELRRDGVEATLAKYERLAKIPSRPPIYGEICAMLYRKAGREGQAVGQYEKLAAGAKSPAIRRRQAFALSKAGRKQEAIPLFEELLRAAPGDMYVHTAYIAAMKYTGCLEAAWKFYHELLARYPEEKGIYGRIKTVGKELEAARLPDPHHEGEQP